MSIRAPESRWGRLTALVVVGLLAGSCAAIGRAPTPADFPRHTVALPMEIHWDLTIARGTVRAEGLVERRNDLIGSAWLQLVGLDAAGAITSFSTPIRVRWRSASDLEWFAIQLRPHGRDERYDVRLYSFEYPEESTP